MGVIDMLAVLISPKGYIPLIGIIIAILIAFHIIKASIKKIIIFTVIAVILYLGYLFYIGSNLLPGF